MDRAGLKLGPIGFGAFKIGRNVKVKYAQGYDLPGIEDVSRLLNAVLDMGVSHIDTAPAYGLSEERIGAAIGHRRDDYLISTKVGETFTDGESTYDFSRQAVRESVERSLKRLKTDRLDLAFIHCPRNDVETLEQTDVVETLLELQRLGSIRAIGVSGYTAEAIRLSLPWADAVMVEYHPYDTSLAGPIAEACEAGVDVIVKKGLSSGQLTPDVAIPFILSNSCVKSLVIGALSVDHMRENVRIARNVRNEIQGE